MERNYTLKTGKTIRCWVNKYFATIMDESGNDIKTFEIADNEDPVFEWEGQTIHINDYDHLSAEELVAKVNQGIKDGDRWSVHPYDAEVCIKKEYAKIAFVVENARTRSFCVPGIGCLLSEDSDKSCIMIPYEGDFKIDDWDYKIELQPMSEKDREYFCNKTFYFDDLWDMVRTGTCAHLVLRNEV